MKVKSEKSTTKKGKTGKIISSKFILKISDVFCRETTSPEEWYAPGRSTSQTMIKENRHTQETHTRLK